MRLSQVAGPDTLGHVNLDEQTLDGLADFICGDTVGPVYRKGWELPGFFRRAGLATGDHSGTRKWWTLDRLREFASQKGAVEKIVLRISDPLEYKGEGAVAEQARAKLNDLLAIEGWHIDRLGLTPVLSRIEPRLAQVPAPPQRTGENEEYGRWAVLRTVGTGGFGVVYEVEASDTRERRALKVLFSEATADPTIPYAEQRRRFQREVAMQESLKHPNIMPILESNLAANPPWFVMPLGTHTLADRIAAGLPEAEAVAAARLLIEVVKFAHGEGALHRDVQPLNVLFVEGRMLLTDFGLGKNQWSSSTALTKTRAGFGTVAYTAPEQWENASAADTRADVFSLGRVLQEMLTGQPPVRYDDKRVPNRFRYLILKATSADPDERYSTVGDLLSALDQVTRGVSDPEAPREVLARLHGEWTAATSDSVCLGVINLVHDLLMRHRLDAEFIRDVVPALPAELMSQYMGSKPVEFGQLLSEYDDRVGELRVPFPFTYMDTIASFYESVYVQTPDLTLKRRLLRRLLYMGAEYTERDMALAAGRILGRIRTVEEGMMAADLLDQNHAAAEWIAKSVRSETLIPLLREKLREADATPLAP